MPIRHERRRRLLADDTLSSVSAEEDESQIRLVGETSDPGTGVRGPYAAKTRFECQRRCLDLVPTRRLTIALVVIGALLSVGLVALLHVCSPLLERFLNHEDLVALHLDGARNISHWSSSMLLGLASLVAMLIYSLRRHRVDDYYGRYRVWLWTALGCLIASLVEATDVSLVVHGACREIADLCSLSDSVAWPAGVALLLTAVAVRLLFEVRRCRLATVALATSASFFLLAWAAECAWFIDVSDVTRPLVHRGSWLVGYVFVLATFLLYARHVMLEIEGLIALAPAKAKRRKTKPPARDKTDSPSAEPSHKPALQLRTDLDAVAKPATASAQRSPAGPVVNKTIAAAANPSLSAHELAGRGLSRAERRRLRRDARMAG